MDEQTTDKIVLDREAATELRELVEDAVQYWCDKHTIAGQTAWKVVTCASIAHEAQLQGIID